MSENVSRAREPPGALMRPAQSAGDARSARAM